MTEAGLCHLQEVDIAIDHASYDDRIHVIVDLGTPTIAMFIVIVCTDAGQAVQPHAQASYKS